MLGKEGFRKINQVGNHLIVAVCPEGSKLKAVAGLLLLGLTGVGILDGIEAGTVGIVFCVCTILDDKDLYILKKPRARPEGVSLVSIDLIKGLSNRDTSAL